MPTNVKKTFYIATLDEEESVKKIDEAPKDAPEDAPKETRSSERLSDSFASPLLGTKAKDKIWFPASNTPFSSFSEHDRSKVTIVHVRHDGIIEQTEIDPRNTAQVEKKTLTTKVETPQAPKVEKALTKSAEELVTPRPTRTESVATEPEEETAKRIVEMRPATPNPYDDNASPSDDGMSISFDDEEIEEEKPQDIFTNDANSIEEDAPTDEDAPMEEDTLAEEDHPEVDELEPKEPLIIEAPALPVTKVFTSPRRKRKYLIPPLSYLKHEQDGAEDIEGANHQKSIIDETLRNFKVAGHVVNFIQGPTVTEFEVMMDSGTKVEAILPLERTLQAALKCKSLIIQAPIPGKNAVGLEVPNEARRTVYLGDLISDPLFLHDGNPTNVALGRDVIGNNVYLDLKKMPHGLIAGMTGSGKSVCVDSIIVSLLYKANPDDVKLILIDPKKIEFSFFEDIPHLASPVITDVKEALAALKWVTEEMENRYTLFQACRARNIAEYNALTTENTLLNPLPYLLVIIDEFGDLFACAGDELESYILRLGQKARASGIHLVMATQRPSTDVIRGSIKANLTTRIAFTVQSYTDSNTILNHQGAEKLLGRGDMLYYNGTEERRIQGAFLSNEEITKAAQFAARQGKPNYMFNLAEISEKAQALDENDGTTDEYFVRVATYCVSNKIASTNKIQKIFNLGFNRAQNIMTAMQKAGIVTEPVVGRAREVLVTLEQLHQIFDELGVYYNA